MKFGRRPARRSVARRRDAASARAAWARAVPFLLVASSLAAATLAPSPGRDAAEAATETADWFPLQGSWIVWCTKSNPSEWNNCNSYHPYFAMDIGVPGTGGLPIDTPVYAAGPGTVIDVHNSCPGTAGDGCGSGAGNFVAIQHPDGRVSRYLHLNAALVTDGAPVARGQKIGRSGNSGSSTSPHLHYDEQQPYGTPVDMGPAKALVNGAVVSYPGAAGYTTWYGAPGTPYGTVIRNDGYQRKAVAGDFDATNSADRATYDRDSGLWKVPGSADVTLGGRGYVPVAGDYDGDGAVEPAGYDQATGLWKVKGAADVTLGGPARTPVPADYTGDGKTDRAVFAPETGTWSVAGAPDVVFGGQATVPVPADYDGDGAADLATFDGATGVWKVQGGTDVVLGGRGQIPVPADYTGDGKADRATYNPVTGVWLVEGAANVTAGGVGLVPVPADFTGDGKADRATYNPTNGVWKVPGQADSVAGGPNRVPVAAAQAWADWQRFTREGRVADTDGDGRSELSVFRPLTGEWRGPSGSLDAFGSAGDVPLTGDVDGDGRADRVAYRPSLGLWFVDLPGWWPFQVTSPAAGDIPVLADFRGDGTPDAAVFRPSTGAWFVAGQSPVVVTPPSPGDVPVTPDLDGDGAVEPGVFRPATGGWFVQDLLPLTLGQSGDVPVVGDLDGDLRSDLGVFRPGTGEWIAGTSGFVPVTFGQAGDVPLLADTSGSGGPVLAVFRPSTGQWVVRNGATTAFGQPGDVPVPRAPGSAPLPPSAPTAASAAPTNGSAVVTFAPPADVGSGPLLSYVITASPGGGTATVAPNATSGVIGGLDDTVSYTFTVTATNGGGFGAPSGSTAPITPTAPARTGYHALTPYRVLDTRDGTGGLTGTFGPGQTRSIGLTGTGGVDGVPASGVRAVVLNVTATGPSAASHLTVWPTGQNQPASSNLNFVAGETVPNLVIATVGTFGQISIFNNAGTVHVIGDVVGWFDDGSPVPGGAELTPVTPFRVLDTRDGVGGPSGKFQAAQTRSLTVTGTGGVNGVPASGVRAVVLNVTATGPSAASHLTVWPTGQNQPASSNLNFVAGETVPNLVIATVGTSGQISIFNNAGTVHVIADVVGYFASSGSGYVGLTPSRVLDTRVGTGGLTGPFGPAQTRPFTVTGTGGVPASGVTAVALNVTVTGATALSFLTAWPSGQPFPGTSNLNFVAAQTVPNLVIVRVGPDGNVNLYNNTGTVHVIADVIGWYG